MVTHYQPRFSDFIFTLHIIVTISYLLSGAGGHRLMFEETVRESLPVGEEEWLEVEQEDLEGEGLVYKQTSIISNG